MTGRRSRSRLPRSEAARRRAHTWGFVAVIAIGAVAMTVVMADWAPVLASVEVPWVVLVLAFAVSERLVFHLRLRQDAHSFSMSEIPLVVALFLVSPLAAITAQAAANVLVLALLRRQTSVKALFNVAQFAAQTAVAVLVFRSIAGLGDPLGLAGWVGGIAATVAALGVADLLIAGVIRLSGGDLSHREIAMVFGLSALAAVLNTALALIAVTLLVVRPESAWLAFTPPAALYLAYRGYVRKREEGERLEALYEATRALHASPQIDAALEAAAERGRAMVDAEYAEVLLFPSGGDGSALRTSAGPGERRASMAPAGASCTGAMQRMLAAAEQGLFRGALSFPMDQGVIEVREAIVVPLVSAEAVVGVFLAVNRLGDVSRFAPEDVRLLQAVASQIAVSLTNGRLEDSLAQLTDLKEQLEELVRSKDELVAFVSHELRTPLTAIVGLAQELRDRPQSFTELESAELISLIAEQGGDLANIVDDLLVVARTENGTLALHEESFDLRAELDALAAGFTRSGRFTTMAVDIAPQAERAFGDVMRVRQIVRNLITNAERYGGPRMWISALPQGHHVRVAVVDDGDGVPSREAEMIFEPYHRATAGVRQPQSVGLGLAVSRKLARMMGGDLTYRRADELTRFELRLPADPGASSAPRVPSAATGASHEDRGRPH